MKRIHLAQYRVKRLANVEMLLERTMQEDNGNVVTRWATTSFSKKKYSTWGQEYEKGARAI